MSNIPVTETLNVNNLGYYLDGWADIVEGRADKTDEVSSAILKGLQDRKMPDIQIGKRRGVVSLTGAEAREYTITTTFPGATTTIYVSQHGNDLYASWKTFIRPVLNQSTLIATLIICGILGLTTGGISRSSSFYGPAQSSFSFLGFLASTFGFLIVAAIFLAVAGRIFKGNILAFFLVEPNIFDAEDITAMSISVHKSVLRALDSAGVDVSKLRIKQNFRGGRRGEDV